MLDVTIVSGTVSVSVTDVIPPGATSSALVAVVGLDEFKYAADTRHGGYAKPSYGSITLAPELFTTVDASWWPPHQILEQINISYTPPGGAVFIVPCIFFGWLREMTKDGFVYDLMEKEGSSVTAVDEKYLGTLNAVFSSACTALGLAFNSAYARVVSPAVDWLAAGERRVLDNLDEIAKFFSHRFYIYDGTLYLVDCFLDNDSVADLSLTNADCTKIVYTSGGPYKKFVGEYRPLGIDSIRLDFLEVEGGGTSIIAAEFDIAKSTGGSLIVPDALTASPYLAPYVGGNLIDNNNATYWVSGTGSVPGAWIGAAVAAGEIVQYAITTRAASPYAGPSKWDLYGRNPYTTEMQFITTVTAEGWRSNELRRFDVPQDIVWSVDHMNSYNLSYMFAPADWSIGEEYRLTVMCQTRHDLIDTALHNIGSILDRPRTQITMPVQEVKIGQRVTIVDTNLVAGKTLTSWFHIDSITYDFTNKVMTIEGEGGRT